MFPRQSDFFVKTPAAGRKSAIRITPHIAVTLYLHIEIVRICKGDSRVTPPGPEPPD